MHLQLEDCLITFLCTAQVMDQLKRLAEAGGAKLDIQLKL